MKLSKLMCLGTLLAVALPLPAFAQKATSSHTIQVDYKEMTLGGQEFIGPRQAIIGNPVDRTLPMRFSYPLYTEIGKNASIKTNTPITDQNLKLTDWQQKVTACLKQKPRLVRTLTSNSILIDGQEGKIVKNSNGKVVCPN